MATFYCTRCDHYGDSHDGDCVPDPASESVGFCHESCLTDEEARAIERAEIQDSLDEGTP